MDAYKSILPTGYQMLWWKDEIDMIGNLPASLNIARNKGADWVEIWKYDRKDFLDCCCKE